MNDTIDAASIKNRRVIRTGIYTDRGKDLLKSIIHGIYKDSSRGNVNASLDPSQYSVETDINHEVVILATTSDFVNDETRPRYSRRGSAKYNSYTPIWKKYAGKDDALRQWIAVKAKHIVRKQFHQDSEWSREFDDQDHVVDAFDEAAWDRISVHIRPTIAQVYAIYDALLGRQNLDRKYPKEFLDKVIGVQRDPLQTEAAKIRIDEKRKLEEWKKAELEKIYSQQEEEKQKAYEEIKARYEPLKVKVFDDYTAKLAEIEEKAKRIENSASNLFAGLAA